LLLRELERAGYQPTYERVDTPAAMTSALDGHAWDLVIGDYSMPAFSGPAALALLRARDPDTPFIFVSGTIGEDVAVEAMKAGAQDFLTKGNLRRLIRPSSGSCVTPRCAASAVGRRRPCSSGRAGGADLRSRKRSDARRRSA